MTTISLKEAQQFGRMKGLFSEQLLKEIQLNLDQKNKSFYLETEEATVLCCNAPTAIGKQVASGAMYE